MHDAGRGRDFKTKTEANSCAALSELLFRGVGAPRKCWHSMWDSVRSEARMMKIRRHGATIEIMDIAEESTGIKDAGASLALDSALAA